MRYANRVGHVHCGSLLMQYLDYDITMQLCTLQALSMYVIILAADTTDSCNIVRTLTRIAMGVCLNYLELDQTC